MVNVIAIFKTVTSLIPTVIDGVKIVEAAVPVAGSGSAKLAMIKDILEHAFKTATDAVLTFEQVWPALSAVVASIVALFNAKGIFTKNAAPAVTQ